MRILFLYTFVLLTVASLHACARSKKAASGSSALIQVVEASERRTKPGRQETAPSTEYRFQVIWKSQSPPTDIYWRPDATSWIDIKVTRPEKRPGLGPNDFMIVERNIDIANIRPGDNLTFINHHHSHDDDPMPSAVKKMPVKSLYIKTKAAPGKWVAIPVTVRRLPDLILP